MADLTITIPDTAVQRVRDAFTEMLDLGQPATVEDVRQYIIADLKQKVQAAERRVAQRAAQDAGGDLPDIT